ncbi:uncharacterized protein LOC18428848 isoform X1 [Amborella trichopoda]|uniref:uncharacterized protein LOC18428848 isoform X1 n=1 Tax=Amborella trichopoda TaxID=13333 RepID=UPI0009BF2C2D|nr:uncharacterized protein LOC18428848 isoform X1 [Amborella trichopoda]|eukprot:XP_020519658.1 uncharacterized protein LOC18428848 isoform X1 [Amborella trichopoda]
MPLKCSTRNRGKSNGGFGVSSKVSSQHRRSKSASDKNLGSERPEISHSKGMDSKEHSKDLRNNLRCYEVRMPTKQASSDTTRVTLPNSRSSLENDIEQLQMHLHNERRMRNMLEKAMGRASSTLSPGHRHFASQTWELITEIELLEKEVANREQQVLTLYRSIFDQCISGVPSKQSSGMSSPVRAKPEARRHPSIISSAFCSSKNFHSQPFHILSSIKDPGKKNVLKKSKTRNASQLSSKVETDIKSNSHDNNKNHEKVPPSGKNSLASLTLRDHLHQSPDKLSEELVRCMIAIYRRLHDAASTKPRPSSSPFLLRSSSSVVLPQHVPRDSEDWPCRSMVEIQWISTKANHFSHASSYAIRSFKILVQQLEKVDTSQMDSEKKTAFWINIYNSLVMHAYLAFGIPHSALRRMTLFHKASYNIGGHVISAYTIEHTIFGFRTPRTGRWFETILSTAKRWKSEEEKQLFGSKFGPLEKEPLVYFALCNGAHSDPLLRVYTAKRVREELETAKREFIQSNVVIKKSRKVFLPKVIERYAKEASLNLEDLLSLVSENVDKKMHDSIKECMENKSSKKIGQVVEWLPYDTKFRYVFSGD